MAWFGNLFSKKSSAADGLASDSELFGQGQAQKSAANGSQKVSDRKNIRLEQRELLYAVVRETMTRSGLVTSSYKYKVLSLDPQGRHYLVMMDVKQGSQSQTLAMPKIELLLTQEALSRHGIQITGVYWRFSEPNALESNERSTPDTRVKPVAATANPAPVPSVKPMAVDAVDARKTLEKAFNKPREHREAAASAFADTLLLDPEDQVRPLSATKIGTLN